MRRINWKTTWIKFGISCLWITSLGHISYATENSSNINFERTPSVPAIETVVAVDSTSVIRDCLLTNRKPLPDITADKLIGKEIKSIQAGLKKMRDKEWQVALSILYAVKQVRKIKLPANIWFWISLAEAKNSNSNASLKAVILAMSTTPKISKQYKKSMIEIFNWASHQEIDNELRILFDSQEPPNRIEFRKDIKNELKCFTSDNTFWTPSEIFEDDRSIERMESMPMSNPCKDEDIYKPIRGTYYRDILRKRFYCKAYFKSLTPKLPDIIPEVNSNI